MLAMYFKHFSCLRRAGSPSARRRYEAFGQTSGRGVIETGEHSTGITNDEMASKLLTASIRASNRKRSGLHRGHGRRGYEFRSWIQRKSIFAVGSAQLTDSAKGIINSVAAV